MQGSAADTLCGEDESHQRKPLEPVPLSQAAAPPTPVRQSTVEIKIRQSENATFSGLLRQLIWWLLLNDWSHASNAMNELHVASALFAVHLHAGCLLSDSKPFADMGKGILC